MLYFFVTNECSNEGCRVCTLEDAIYQSGVSRLPYRNTTRLGEEQDDIRDLNLGNVEQDINWDSNCHNQNVQHRTKAVRASEESLLRFPCWFASFPSSEGLANNPPHSSSTVTRTIPSSSKHYHNRVLTSANWQTFQQSRTICSQVRLRCWCCHRRRWTRSLDAVGENQPFTCRKGRICADYASVCWSFDWSRIHRLLSKIYTFVQPLSLVGRGLIYPETYSSILRMDREPTRTGSGYEGDGFESQEGRAAVWRKHINTLHARSGESQFEILGGIHARYSLVQLCQPQPAWC